MAENIKRVSDYLVSIMINPEVIRFPAEAIEKAVSIFSTPFFLYEESQIRKRCRILKNAFGKYFPSFYPLYAVKANSNPHIVKIILEEGFGLDCSSESEAWILKELESFGMYTGNYTTEDELKYILSIPKLLLNLDDETLLKSLAKIRIPDFLSFRINPGITKGDMENNLFAGENAKFGIPWEKAVQAYREAKNLGVKRFGIHAMTGSNVLDDSYFKYVAEKMWDIMELVSEELDIEFEYMNIGGGFGVPYRPEEQSLDIEKIAGDISQVFQKRSALSAVNPPALMIEPGRWIMADAGFLVTKAHVIKEGYKKYVGVDASANNMPRPAIYGAYHHISVLNANSKKEEVVNVVGRLCENSDQFAIQRSLPRMSVGDFLVIHNSGAHAFSMGHNYNGRLRCAEFLLQENGEVKNIRNAETIEVLFQNIPLWK